MGKMNKWIRIVGVCYASNEEEDDYESLSKLAKGGQGEN